ncbi:MAG: hypothetical protein ACXWDO_05090 [Bacteroidia bacterium]
MKYTKNTMWMMFAFLLTGLMSCQKATDVQPQRTLESKSANGKEGVTVYMYINEDVVTEGSAGIFYADVVAVNGNVNCGKITLQKWNPKRMKWDIIKAAQDMELSYGSATYSIDQTTLADSGSYRWVYVSGANCGFKSANSGSLDLVVVKQ